MQIDSDSDDELPVGWEEKTTEDGNVYFVNSFINKTQWTHPTTGFKKVIPKEFPFGWSKSSDDSGNTIFVNKETGLKTYVDPRLAFAKEEKKHVYDFRQRFDSSSTAYQVLHGIDLSGKYAMITGCNRGIGLETAKSLARHGCKVLLANRNMEETNRAIKTIVKEINVQEDNLIPVHLDLASLESVKKCAASVKAIFSDHLDIVILNAAVFGLPYSETADGVETTVQVNHLSHMYLALLLEPLLRRGARVVFVSSESHRFADLKNVFTNQNIAMTKENYSSMTAYNNSKLYNVITAKVLSEEWQRRGVAVSAVHPGNMVWSGLSASWWLFRLAFFLVRPFTKSLQQAAATAVYAAAAPELRGASGLYYNNCYCCADSALAGDRPLARALFRASLRLLPPPHPPHLQAYLHKYEVNDR